MADPTLTSPFSLKVSPRGYDALFDAILAAVPKGRFYDIAYPIVPWRQDPVLFQLTTDTPGIPIQVNSVHTGSYYQTVDAGNLVSQVQYVPQSNVTTFGITLGRGLNRLVLSEQVPGGRVINFEIVATTLATLFEAMGRTISTATQAVGAQSQALRSPYATRMLDQVADFSGIFSELQSLKILSSKLLIRSTIWFPATSLGTKNIIEAFSVNTPVFVPQRQDPSLLHIERSRINRVQENSAGQEAHVWFPNSSVTRWAAFIKMADSFRNNYQLQVVLDDLVRVLYKSEIQYHIFDFDALGATFLPNFSQVSCFNNFTVSGTMSVVSHYKVCVWNYYFDDFIPAASPIGSSRGAFDTGVPLDLLNTFDVDPIDPFTDGWIGWSLTGRFEQDVESTFDAELALDSSITPALGYVPQCVYQGPYTQMMNTMNSEIPVDATTTYNPSLTFFDNYAPGAIVELDMSFPYPPPQLIAGVPVLVVLKYVDGNDQTNPTGNGTVTIQETPSGITNFHSVTGGYAQFNLIPTKAGPLVHWALSDGTYTGQAPYQTPPGELPILGVSVLPGPFGGLKIGAIVNQQVNVPFTVTVQATDVYGNSVTEVGINPKVVIQPFPAFGPTSATPNYVDLINGFASFDLTISTTGTGQLKFLIDAFTQFSNPFTVF